MNSMSQEGYAHHGDQPSFAALLALEIEHSYSVARQH